MGHRSTPMREAKIKAWVAEDPETWEEHPLRGFRRNEQLINLKYIPQEIQNKVVAEYHAQGGKDKSNLMEYFMEKRLRNLLEHMGDF